MREQFDCYPEQVAGVKRWESQGYLQRRSVPARMQTKAKANRIRGYTGKVRLRGLTLFYDSHKIKIRNLCC
ncbi:hypothetical protein KBT16_32675, partial [Nostoc sp. CCCryo 231-06]|nr:hypothetical protein [Nostoc sp. CCCryo 231-06]